MFQKNRALAIAGLAVLIVIILGIVYVTKTSSQKVSYVSPTNLATSVAPSVSVAPSPSSQPDAFSSRPADPGTSNVVGYMAYGAFVTELPGWMVQNWMMKNGATVATTIITPKVDSGPRDFSDIVMYTAPSTESFNALTLYTNDIAAGQNNSITTKETILNDAGDMYIYHIERMNTDMCFESYYFDGNNSTAQLTFSVNQKDCQADAAKVKDFVQRLGKGKPQG